jgi:hypothetical protein
MNNMILLCLTETSNFIIGTGVTEHSKQKTRTAAGLSVYGRKQNVAYIKLIPNQLNGGKTKGQFQFVISRRKKYD